MRRKNNYVIKNIGNENILVPIGKEVLNLNGILVLNDTARFIWDRLEKENSAEELIKSVINEYDIDIKTADKEVEIFIEELKSRGLVAD